jgi:transposase-like protein
MQSQFKNLQQLLDFFKDETVCKTYLEQQRWGGNVACPHCGSLKVYRTNRGFKCGEKVCAKKFSVTVGTIFENSKIGLRTWFAAMFLISTSKKGVSSLQLAGQLGITQKTAWFLVHRIREMLKEKSTEKFNGTVEADEAFIGGKENNKHRNKKRTDYNRILEVNEIKGPANKTMVLGIVERGESGARVRTFVVPDRKSETLQTLMRDNVETNSRLITDSLQSYVNLKKEYSHIAIKHTYGDYRTYGDEHTNNIEGYWSILKRGIYGIYHFVSTKHLQRYCDEFAYRYNTRNEGNIDRFNDALTKVANARVTYKGLIGK